MKKIMLLLCLSFLAILRVQAMSSSIDVDKIRYVAGEGARLYAIVICHGNNERLDNFVFGYRTDDAVLSYADVLDTFVKADSRFDVRTNGDKISSVSFDLDGNGIFDERDVIAPGEWSVSADMLASDGSTPVVALCNGVNASDVPYYFYLPEPDEVGVWVPEAMTVSLSDESFVLPVLVQPQGNTVANTTNWQASSSNETYRLDRTKIVTPYTFIDGSYHARPSMVGATGVTYVRYRPMIGGTYVESNYLTLTIKEPEVPMTSIIFTEEEIHSPLNRVVEYEYTYEPDNATYTAIKLVSSDTKIATWSASAGLKTTTVAGTATITASCNYNSSVTASFNLVSSLRNPVTGVSFGPGTEDGVIDVPVKQLIGLRPIIEPADADIPSVTIKLSDNGSSREDYTCTTYNVNYWDANNVRSQFLELSGHRPTGDRPAKLTVTSADGNYSKDFVVNVVESDRTPLPGGYEDGTIILNEEWFGHTNGGLNYITEDGEIIYQAYERENPGMSFGCTSQY
ncbi:MAG: Ig-like domain-containing protein, partial [Muribaculaceae bacterium]|nr:Ig-like domain-containing protein [Muribaculaceae bacterium]